jgi:DNA polymerase delta subunit 1
MAALPARLTPCTDAMAPQVLGLPPNADYNAIQRAYKKKVFDARGNEAEQQRVEAAHSTLMMSALTSRLQGKAEVDKDVIYADRARYFPWRPRLFLAEQKVMLYTGIAQAVLLAWALLSPLTAGTQPVIWCECCGGHLGVVSCA